MDSKNLKTKYGEQKIINHINWRVEVQEIQLTLVE